jgi:hypothetical protein
VGKCNLVRLCCVADRGAARALCAVGAWKEGTSSMAVRCSLVSRRFGMYRNMNIDSTYGTPATCTNGTYVPSTYSAVPMKNETIEGDDPCSLSRRSSIGNWEAYMNRHIGLSEVRSTVLRMHNKHRLGNFSVRPLVELHSTVF